MPGRLLTLYHHTSNAAAAAILRDRSMISAACLCQAHVAPG